MRTLATTWRLWSTIKYAWKRRSQKWKHCSSTTIKNVSPIFTQGANNVHSKQTCHERHQIEPRLCFFRLQSPEYYGFRNWRPGPHVRSAGPDTCKCRNHPEWSGAEKHSEAEGTKQDRRCECGSLGSCTLRGKYHQSLAILSSFTPVIYKWSIYTIWKSLSSKWSGNFSLFFRERFQSW